MSRDTQGNRGERKEVKKRGEGKEAEKSQKGMNEIQHRKMKRARYSVKEKDKVKRRKVKEIEKKQRMCTVKSVQPNKKTY